MGECYYHGGTYESCPSCYKERIKNKIKAEHYQRAEKMFPPHNYCSECGAYYRKGTKHKCKKLMRKN